MTGQRWLIAFLMMCFTSVTHADVAEALDGVTAPSQPKGEVDWFDRSQEGWFSYEDPVIAEEKEEEVKEREKVMPSINSGGKGDPLEELKQLQENVERAKAKAVLYPTTENVLEWTRVTRELLDRSALFADVAQRTVWQNPELDYSLDRPVNPAGQRVWADDFRETKNNALREIAETHGLFFFFTEHCPYCHEMAPYIQQFAKTYGFEMIAMSIDGSSMPQFPDARYEPLLADKLDVKITPAIFLVNPNENVIEPIAFGSISLKQLEDRIYRLFKLPVGQTVHKVGQLGGIR